jgi:hypothetical protein
VIKARSPYIVEALIGSLSGERDVLLQLGVAADGVDEAVVSGIFRDI